MGAYETGIRLLSGFFLKLYRVRVHGKENIPACEQGMLLCSNHLSAIDPFLIVASMHIPVHFMAKAELFRIPLVRKVIKTWGAFPINRGAGDLGAIKKSVSLIEEGGIVGIFPQGHRRPGIEPENTEIRAGAGLILRRTGVSALPVRIVSKGNRIRPFRRTDIYIGKPVLPLLPSAQTEADHKEADMERTRAVFDRICEMGKNESSELS